MASDDDAIRVIGRFRPLNERELAVDRGSTAAAPRFAEDGRSVWVGPDEATGNYALDAVLPPEATHQDLYAHASGLVSSVMHGYNATILAYGQVCVQRGVCECLFGLLLRVRTCASAACSRAHPYSLLLTALTTSSF